MRLHSFNSISITGDMMIRIALIAVATLGMIATQPAASQSTSQKSSPDPWWQHAVFYEIYPRSFQDSNGDGIGDLNGITSRLDYLQKLGIDAIWIAPCFPSPLVDFGYDVSDYDDIDPQFGTMADFDKLMAEANKRHMKILLDFVANHSSDKHPWFIASRSSKTDPKRDWYIWRDGKIDKDGKMGPPNNWHSIFGGSAWTLDPATGQYYYHRFYAQQPDLNWRNPAVEKAMFDQMRFWLDRGVAGFRLDSIDMLVEDPDFGDEEYRRDAKGDIMRDRTGAPFTTGEKTANLPEIHDIIKRMRAMFDSYPGDRVLVGETYLPNVQELDKWYGGAAKDELQLPMDTQLGVRNTLDPAKWRNRLEEAETSLHGSMPLFVYDNHDNPRLDRYCREANGAAPGADCQQIQKLLTAILLTARDAAMIYYGDEIGMTTGPVPTAIERRRDAERTPMQWNTAKNSGFSTAASTWLPVESNYETINVEAEEKDPNSLLQWHKDLIALRRKNGILRDGDQQPFNTGNDSIVAYTRSSGDRKIIVITNFSNNDQQIQMGELASRKATILKANFSPELKNGAFSTVFRIPAYGAFVGEIH
jgi:alpha-glucosidase